MLQCWLYYVYVTMAEEHVGYVLYIDCKWVNFWAKILILACTYYIHSQQILMISLIQMLVTSEIQNRKTKWMSLLIDHSTMIRIIPLIHYQEQLRECIFNRLINTLCIYTFVCFLICVCIFDHAKFNFYGQIVGHEMSVDDHGAESGTSQTKFNNETLHQIYNWVGDILK